MADTNAKFDARIHKLTRKHKRMARGVVTSVNHDGLIIAQPRRRGIQLPIKGPLMFAAVFFFFKGFLIASIGLAGYNDRVEKLNAGSQVEHFGGALMQADPISLYISQQLGPVLR